jgi:transcriptional regulator with XRE-family HTH domain
MADDAHAAILRKIGEAVRDARTARGLSQAEVASRIGMTRSSVANLEAGRQGFPFPTLAALVQVLGLDLAALVELVDLPPQPDVPHNVRILPVLEVDCLTCGGTVLDVTYSRAQAQEAKAAHIAAMAQEESPRD